MCRKPELNSRQWALYKFLKKRGNEWTTQWRIAAIVKEYNYDAMKEDTAMFHDSKARKTMTADIRTINNSGVIQKVIITGPKGVKLANKEEFKNYINKEFSSVFRKLTRVRTKAKKGLNDQQYKITFGEYERNVIEAFIEE